MHGLVDELHRDTATLLTQAGRLRDVADGLRRHHDVAWASTRADHWRGELDTLRSRIEQRADLLDAAAGELRRHTHEVERRLAEIAAAEAWFGARLADARRVLQLGVELVGEAAVTAAQHTVEAARRTPAPGSPDWLHFRG